MDSKRLEKLLDLYFDQGLTESTNLELDQMIQSSEEVRLAFWKRARLHGMLRHQMQEQLGSTPIPNTEISDQTVEPASRTSQSRSRRWLIAIAAIAACLLLFVGIHTAFTDIETPPRNGTQTASNDSVAVANPDIVSEASDDERENDPSGSPRGPWVAFLRNSIDAQWGDHGTARRVGESLAAGRLTLKSGLIEFQTNRGAVVVVEGPADLDLVDDMEIRCRQGQLTVNAPPPAQGFLVRTESVDVVDLGTAFSMQVDINDDARIHVIEGEVDLVSPSDDAATSSLVNVAKRRLGKGESVEVESPGNYRDIEISDRLTNSKSRTQSITSSFDEINRRLWKHRRTEVAQDPSCLVYYDFSRETEPQTSDLILPNRAKTAADGSDGTIIGCDWTDGRWKGKHALDFKSLSDRILLSVAGRHNQLTCIVKIRVDALKEGSTPILMSRSMLARGLHWSIETTAENSSVARLVWRRNSESTASLPQEFSTKPILRDEQMGTWMQLAFVWNSDKGELQQFVDGKIVDTQWVETSGNSPTGELDLRDLQIGNGSPTVMEADMRPSNLCGRIDEFVLFGRELAPHEIQAFHNLGRSYWTSNGRDGDWEDADNWSDGISPNPGDDLYINHSGAEQAKYKAYVKANYGAIHVGSFSGQLGDLIIEGGVLNVDRNSSFMSRVGSSGGEGRLEQRGGDVRINTLQVGLDPGTKGQYVLQEGRLLLSRAPLLKKYSLSIGDNGGEGVFVISDGSIVTRQGVVLGRRGGKGAFRVLGSKADAISIGSFGAGDGEWYQGSGCTLDARIDDGGVTPIQVDEADGDGSEGANVTFCPGSLLDVGFLGESQSGSWDVMTWKGTLSDEGLQFAPTVDTEVWSFEFVDTNQSGAMDTLRVTARPPHKD
ncbi:LamG domain-containing protein [Aporhodopirellula aestuarii]|uniref:LamG domain-containing protein n=1 Tax=Aporhodopirellula aestuarii TaxID=2950107 RepID=A0ABT0UGS4_9BACT|nr:LamG domain-containing protein [Aporhodopirellula aestuarii]MCM2375278.1 LamG domain-containing protein [Aporhodopirellula aestuarii]